MRRSRSRNVLGTALQACSLDPMTGYFRDGCCETGPSDRGRHIVCAVMTDEFLAFSKGQGNDLSTPRPEFRFLGLKAGDRWCLCLERWREAYKADCAPQIVLEATHEIALERLELSTLRAFAVEPLDS
ncbi:DUF2237 family protein [Algimonas porphyrae]|uniref:DUF2237 domain-containing protein n=1 Tax=Algimonas porphyrae TaxID=1128113 RepID=A0ABQ5UXV9_9PROT|nr:DUF2237 domain-containing protein [Algimonas porphyrae]GLQ20148.1 hypothetical protein GCM10007854_11030 [Algimonas porphyrae]